MTLSAIQHTSRQDHSPCFGCIEFPLKAHVSPHGRVTALSMMKDEGPFVLEWIAHHLSLGFTDLVIYTNDCSDGTDDMLMRLEELGLVHHRRNEIREGVRPQPSALKHAQREPVVLNSDWLIVFDADEFLCIRHAGGTLDDLITATKSEGANGLVITWRIYGSNGIQHWSRAPVTEQYLSAAPPMWNKGWGVKTLFKYDSEYWKLGIHRPKIKNKHLEGDFAHSVKWLNGSGRPMEEYFKFRGWRSITRTVGYDWAQMNHYAIKSMDSYAMRKMRGNVNNKANKYNSDYWALQDRNEVYDAAGLLHKDRRQGILDVLMSDPVLSDLHFKAVDMAEERLDRFKETTEYSDLIVALKTASQVPIAKVEAKPPKARDAQKIAAQMSEIEKRVAAKPLPSATGGANPARDPYVKGTIDLSEEHEVATFDNHGLKLPADPRIFSDAALSSVTEGKFLRNHARCLPGILWSGDVYLEIGAGIGFLAAHLANSFPDLRILAQEERHALLVAASALWKTNKVISSGTRRLCGTPLFHALDSQHRASGLEKLIEVTGCTVLYCNDPRLSAQMIAQALSVTLTTRLIIIGERGLSGDFDAKLCTGILEKKGYKRPETPPLADALTFFRAGG